ncbi:MAG: ABC transporter permease, partial [Chloroflexota bacterium]|nr:ABC transporter permease [Chloroflexota bacterium]
MSSASEVLVAPRPEQRAERAVRAHGMGIGQSVATALESLNANKLRSLLTMLGIIIGVGAVIIMISLGRGASANVAERLQGLGTNMLMISPGSTGFGGVRAGAGSRNTLTQADADAAANQLAGLNGVSPVIGGGVQSVYNNQNWATRVSGVYPIYQQIENYQIKAGSLMDDPDEQSARNVAVLGQTVVDNLFGNGNTGSGNADAAIGQTIRINNVPFQVVGVLAPKGGGFGDPDDVILVPFKTAQVRLFHRTFVNQIVAQVADAKQMDSAQAQLTDLLRQQHRLTGTQDDFTIRNLNDIVQTAQGVTQTLTLLLAGVAGVSLVVGGIGIMNIMLVSVTERTREIGIRMAIG